jgi:hypothetical protein
MGFLGRLIGDFIDSGTGIFTKFFKFISSLFSTGAANVATDAISSTTSDAKTEVPKPAQEQAAEAEAKEERLVDEPTRRRIAAFVETTHSPMFDQAEDGRLIFNAPKGSASGFKSFADPSQVLFSVAKNNVAEADRYPIPREWVEKAQIVFEEVPAGSGDGKRPTTVGAEPGLFPAGTTLVMKGFTGEVESHNINVIVRNELQYGTKVDNSPLAQLNRDVAARDQYVKEWEAARAKNGPVLAQARREQGDIKYHASAKTHDAETYHSEHDYLTAHSGIHRHGVRLRNLGTGF